MAEIIPFRGYTYNPKKVDIGSALAPPYDVVRAVERDRFCEESPFNVLRLELPSPPLEGARDLFLQWIEEGVLLRDEEESIYPYEIQFELNGMKVTRTGLVCLLKVEPWERRVVLPHEKTFKQVTKERLELLKTVRAQFSQIFLLSKDIGELSSMLKQEGRRPLFQVKDHLGNWHELFKISDKEVIHSIKSLFHDRPLYIADGHHRYTTAITFREECERFGLFKGIEPPPHEYVMAYIVDTSDPGLVCLPTHRVVYSEGVGPNELEKGLGRYFDKALVVEGVGVDKELDGLLEECSSTPCFFVVLPCEERAVLFRLNQRGRELLWAKGISGPLMELDVISVDEIAIKETYKASASELKQRGRLRYEALANDVLTGLSPHEILFYLRPTPVEAMLKVADAGLTMPHKATYFYPKILTGTVIREL